MMHVNGKTKIFGLFGDPVLHSLSPAMHNAAFEYEGLNYVYVPFNVKSDNLKEAVCSIKALGISGVNVTIPHKQGVMDYMDELSEEARLIGAVNTIHNDNGKLIGYNTDGRGFIRSLEESGFNCKGKSALIFGAGGASRGICVTLGLSDIEDIYIVNRTIERAEEIALAVNENTNARAHVVEYMPEKFGNILSSIDLVVNTTPQGMHGSESGIQNMIDWGSVNREAVISDIVYRPFITPFLLEATRSDLKVVTGDSMLLYQGVLAYEIWLKRKAPAHVMKDVLFERLTIE